MRKSTFIALAATLTVSACDPGDELEHDEVQDEVFQEASGDTLQSLLNEVLGFVGGEAASFVVGEIFGLTMPEGAVDLSDEALAEIRAIVREEFREGELTTRNGLFKAVVTEYNGYNRAPCAALEESGDCSDSELTFRYGLANDILSKIGENYEVYKSWASSQGEVLTDQDWQVFLSGNVRLAITMDLAMRRELYEIDYLKGLDVAADSWNNLRATAGDHLQVLNAIEAKYGEIKGQFGTVSLKNVGGKKRGCYLEPGSGEPGWCTEEFSDYNCTVTQGGSSCSEDATSETVLTRIAEEHRANRLAVFESMALGSQASFDAMQAAIEAISNAPAATCQPLKSVDAGPLYSNVEAQDKCPGVCEEAGGDFTGEWRSKDGTSVCDCKFQC